MDYSRVKDGKERNIKIKERKGRGGGGQKVVDYAASINQQHLNYFMLQSLLH